MNLESFLAELRSAREAGVVFTLDTEGRIQTLGPVPRARRCPLEFVCCRVAHRAAPYYKVPDLINMDRMLGWSIMCASDNDRAPSFLALRGRLLEACGLVEQAPMP